MNTEALLARLRTTDHELPGRSSLDPRGRSRATRLEDLGRRLLGDVPPRWRVAVVETLDATARAVRSNFPDNLFADFDALAGHLARGAGTRTDVGPWLQRTQRLLVELHEVFGMRSPIRFRYIHDFLYGYDWAKWVKRDPAQRCEVPPYDPEFLASLLERGRELVRSIEEGGTADYPRLDEDDPARNVFTFSRQPADEERLLRSLAEADALPLRAWELEAAGRWREPFAQLRLEEAARLGVATRPGARPDRD